MLFSQNIDPNQAGKPKPFILVRPFIAVWHWLVPPTQAHRDRQSSTARLVAIGLLVTGCLTAIVLGFMYARPLHDQYQNWQAEKLYQEARDLVNNGQGVQAFQRVQEAVKMAPENPNVVRMNAEILTMARRPEALYYLDQLDRIGATQENDRVLRVRALMSLDRPKEASELLEDVLNKQVPTDQMMKLAETVWGKSQKDEMLAKSMRNYAARHPEDHEHALRLARVEIMSGKSLEISSGIRRAWEVADGKDEALGLKALELLDSSTDLPPDDSRRLIERLRSHPRAGGWHLVAALSRQVKLEPSRRSELILEAARTARSRQREDLVPLIRWLVMPPQNEYLTVLSLVSEDEAITYKPLLDNYLTAITALRRFPDLERLIEDPRVGRILSHTEHSFYRAHLAYVTQKTAEETRAALIVAKNACDIEHRADLLTLIAQYAEERGHFDIAEEAFQAVSRDSKQERAGFDGLIRMTKSNGNTEGLLKAAGEAVRRWPDDIRYQEEFLYANLLTGREVELAFSEVQRLHKLQPKDYQRRLMVALACWRLKDLRTATIFLNDMDLTGGHLTPGQQAVYAAIAKESVAENAAEVARIVLKDIDPKARMLPEERACFNRAAQ